QSMEITRYKEKCLKRKAILEVKPFKETLKNLPSQQWRKVFFFFFFSFLGFVPLPILRTQSLSFLSYLNPKSS
ncbi:MAG: hypothetical protein K6253_01735, partial [Candidatus Liberibacter asiaticus]|nr:hypothetical protein [Candidatus Liberibacter asiaticus]